MATHFSDIGFGPTDRDVLIAVAAGIENGTAFKTPRGVLIYWSPGEGIEIWSQINEVNGRNVLMDSNPHFSGLARMRVGLLEVVTYDGRPSDGSIYVKTGIYGSDPQAGDGSLLVDVPDFDVIRERLVPHSIITLQIAAFAEAITCYRTEEDFMSSQTPLREFEGRPVYLGPELAVPHEDNGSISSDVHMTARVHSVNTTVNLHTGVQFYHLCVTTQGGMMDVVADPSMLTDALQVGGVIRGDFWLSGKCVE
jgi:hypothetical protein